MSFSLIACIGKNRELGKNNDLIFHFKEDMRFFRETTSGHVVVMGYNTWLSLNRKALPNRKNYVVSPFEIKDLPNNIEQVFDFEAYAKENQNTDEEIFIIGGAKTYEDFLPYAKTLYLTEVEAEADGADVYFPDFSDFAKHADKEELAQFSDKGTKFVINKYTKRS